MSEYLRKRYLNDVLLYKSREETRSITTAGLVNFADNATVSTNSITDQKEHFNITMELLSFRKLAILACKNLSQAISNDIEPFFSTTKDALNFIQNLENNWKFSWKQHVGVIETEIKSLGDKYASKQVFYEEDWSGIEEPIIHTASDDDNASGMEIPLSRLCAMKAFLEKPDRHKDMVIKPLTTQEVPDDRRISSKLSLRPNFDKSPGSGDSAVFIEMNEMADILDTMQPKTSEEMDDDADLNEVPDYDSLSDENISLNLSDTTGPVIIPKASVLRMIVKDSQDNQHVVSKHYVQTEECHVCIPLREKKVVDDFRRKRETDLRSSNRNSDDSDSDDTSSDELSRPKRNTRSSRRSSSETSSSSARSYRSPSYSGNSNDSDHSSNHDNYSHYSDTTDISNELADIPDESSDSKSHDSFSDSSSDTRAKRQSNNKRSREKRKNDDDDAKKEEDTSDDVKKEEDTKDDETTTKGNSDWRKDPLLKRIRVNYSSDSSDTATVKTDSELKDKTETETETETEDEPGATSSKRAKLSITPQKSKRRVIYDTDDDDTIALDKSDSSAHKSPLPKVNEDDSDVEFVSMSVDSPSKKGRRNIKGILSEDALAATTRAAYEEEKERIKRLQAKATRLTQLSQVSQSQVSIVSTGSRDGEFVLDENAENPIAVHGQLARRLYPHQREGIQFLWDNCYESVERLQEGDKGAGCILAHCMGLGKTFQVVALVHTLFKHTVTNTKRVMVICPITTMPNWRKEFRLAQKLANNVSIEVFGLPNNQFEARSQEVQSWFRRGGVLLIGYESFVALVKRELEDLNKVLLDPGADLIVCDEGHLLKNGGSNRTRILSRVATKRRIILTGTPMQNNLEEYYCMVGFVKPKFLGTRQEYRNRFVNPINNGQFEDSTPNDIQKMRKRSHVLHKMTRNFIQRFEESELAQHLPEKYDYAIKIQMCDLQINLLKKFLEVCNYRDIFANVQVIRAVCAHPYLLHMQAITREQNQGRNPPRNEVAEMLRDLIRVDPNWWRGDLPEDAVTNINYGPKLQVMLTIVKETMARNEKLLIFSSSLLELDLIEQYLTKDEDNSWVNGTTYYRIDGGVPTSRRERYTRTFNTESSPIKLMLLTPKVGGLGLNLYAANRVIIMNVSWNPADDTQSVFRVYRIGQRKTCYVYRLIAMGTTEEVIYERSVTKQAIAGRVVDEMQITRHFQSSDLIAMYRCKVNETIAPKIHKVPKDTLLASVLQKHPSINNYQDHKELLQNLPDEELNEAEMLLAWEEYERENNDVPPPLTMFPEQMPNTLGTFPSTPSALGGQGVPMPPIIPWATNRLPHVPAILKRNVHPEQIPSTLGTLPSTPSTSGGQGVLNPRTTGVIVRSAAPMPIVGSVTKPGLNPTSYTNTVRSTSFMDQPSLNNQTQENPSNMRPNVRPAPFTTGVPSRSYIAGPITSTPKISGSVDNPAPSSSRPNTHTPGNFSNIRPNVRHVPSTTALPSRSYITGPITSTPRVSGITVENAAHSSSMINQTPGNLSNIRPNVRPVSSTPGSAPRPLFVTRPNTTIQSRFAFNSPAGHYPVLPKTLSYNMSTMTMTNKAQRNSLNIRPNLNAARSAPGNSGASSLNPPMNNQGPSHYIPIKSRVPFSPAALAGKTFLFISSATRGGKVLAKFDECGKVLNDPLVDRLTAAQINCAENLSQLPLQRVAAKMFIISQDGVLRQMDNTTPRIPPTNGPALAPALPTPAQPAPTLAPTPAPAPQRAENTPPVVQPPPKVTASITIDHDEDVIEIIG